MPFRGLDAGSSRNRSEFAGLQRLEFPGDCRISTAARFARQHFDNFQLVNAGDKFFSHAGKADIPKAGCGNEGFFSIDTIWNDFCSKLRKEISNV